MLTNRCPGEWVSLTLSQAVQAGGRGATPVVVKVGTVDLDDGSGLCVALQIDDEPAVILAPAVATELIGALRRGIREAAGL
jgi:hypothetical protein